MVRKRKEGRRRAANGTSIRRPESWADWATVIGAPIGLVALVLGYLAIQGGGAHDAATAASPAHVEPVDLVVRNGVHVDPPPRLEITLHNTGGKRAIVSAARIEVRRVGPLQLCVSQGDLPLSTEYEVMLSADARPGEIIETPLHQQIGPDQADRFAIDLGIRTHSGNGRHEAESLPGPYLFELEVSLVSDEGRGALRVGRALVSVPFAPIPTIYFWDRDTAKEVKDFVDAEHAVARELRESGTPMPLQPPWVPERLRSCWTPNTKTLMGMLSTDAVRSPTLEGISARIVSPDLSAIGPPGS